MTAYTFRARSYNNSLATDAPPGAMHWQVLADRLEASIVNGHDKRPQATAILRGHRALFLSRVYGVHSNRVGWIVNMDGSLSVAKSRSDKGAAIGPPRQGWHGVTDETPAVEHIITDGWMGTRAAIDRHGSGKAAESIINRELRGVSRVLWLAALWLGLDIRDIRGQWYHWSDLDQQIWVAAWDCVYHEDAFTDLIRYGRGLVWRRAELQNMRFAEDGKPAKVPGTHKALEYLNNAQALWG